MRHSGFTLVELLTVIAVLAVLAFLSFPVFGSRRQSPKAATRTTLSEVIAACSQYHTLYGVYPDTAPGADGSPSMQSIFMRGTIPRAADQLRPADWDAVAAQLLLLLQNVDRDHFNGTRFAKGRITDTWNATIHYRPARYFPHDGRSLLEIDGSVPPNQDSYQLWSIGPDGVDQYGAAGSDDITNWR